VSLLLSWRKGDDGNDDDRSLSEPRTKIERRFNGDPRRIERRNIRRGAERVRRFSFAQEALNSFKTVLISEAVVKSARFIFCCLLMGRIEDRDDDQNRADERKERE